jgi:rSAM/selenodomain-associated transferase 1
MTHIDSSLRSGSDFSQVLMIFLKEPVEGRVKTRLGKTIGHTKACDIYKEFVRIIAHRTISSHWKTCVFFDTSTPEEEPTFLKKVFPQNTLFIRQQGKDLGARLTHAFRWAFEQPTTQKVSVIGGDSPDLPLNILTESFSRLEQWDVTLGPTPDGGYYLISTKNFVPELFQNISWSTEAVFEETCARIKEFSLSSHIHPKWEDVDTWEDFQIFKKNNPHFPLS